MKTALTEDEFIKYYGAVSSTLDLIATMSAIDGGEGLAKGTLCNAAFAALDQMNELKEAFYRELPETPVQEVGS